jgi:cyclophilin family peptidyl-prolyl cis-trans isomerase
VKHSLIPVLLLLLACASHGSDPLLLRPSDPAINVPAPEVFLARFTTSQGAFAIEVHRSWAPNGADRFYNLAAHGFFDGQRFFRVRQGFIAQFGVPGEPAIAAAWRSATINDDPPLESNKRGTIAYAFTTPNTRATQVYINLSDNQRLDAEGFAPFGVVVTGMEVVDRLYAGYGEAAGGGIRAGKQDALFAGGNAWLAREFPRLDSIRRVTLE